MSLNENGYIIYPLYEKQTLNSKRKEFLSECNNFQEFKPNCNTFVLGGFGALGNPSSFHNLFVRQTRKDVHKAVKEILVNDYINISKILIPKKDLGMINAITDKYLSDKNIL